MKRMGDRGPSERQDEHVANRLPRSGPRGITFDVPSVLLTLLSGGALILVVVGVTTGSIGMFLNPRIVPRTVIALAALVLVSGVHSAWSVRFHARPDSHSTADGHQHTGHRHASGLRRLLPFVVALVLVPAAARHASADYSDIRLFVPGGTVSRGVVPDPARTGAAATETTAVGETGWVGPANAELLAEVAALAQEPAPGDDPVGRAQLPADGPIVLENDTFDPVVQALWDDPASFQGRTVRLTGFVYRRPEWNSRRFVAARMLIWCCVADAMVTGVLVDPGDHGDVPRDRQWIEIEGTLGVTDRFTAGSIEMVAVPTLTQIEWHQVSPPAQEYIFSDVATAGLTPASGVDSR